jgi:radical SAM superfamily enzyme YgiQ (UPF0313 family)
VPYADILLIQPSVLKRIPEEHPAILSYFEAQQAIGSLMGDSPLEPNYGLLTLASVLRQADIEVSYLDLTLEDLALRREGLMLTDEYLGGILARHPARVFGTSYMTAAYGTWGKTLSRSLRRLFPESFQLVGGIHPTMVSTDVLAELDDVDIVVTGEAENVIAAVVRQLLADGAAPSLPGVFLRRRFATAQAHLEARQLDVVPYPAYNMIARQNPAFVPRVYTARGCPQRCTFCVVSDFFSDARSGGRYLRSVHTDAFQSHVETMLSRYRPSFFCVGDLTFAHSRSDGEAACAAIERAYDATGVTSHWWAQTRADLIDEALARKMFRAGCRQIAIGVEGATDVQRKRVVKHLGTQKTLDSLRMLRDAGFEIQTYWIAGLPRDDERAVRSTLELMVYCLEQDLTHLTHISVLVPYPGTALYRYPERLGIALDEPRASDYSQYWMNCDPYGCGVPVYSTLDASGRVLLTPAQIYGLWLEMLAAAEQVFRSKIERTLGYSLRKDPRLREARRAERVSYAL